MYRTQRHFGNIIHRIWQLPDFRRKGRVIDWEDGGAFTRIQKSREAPEGAQGTEHLVLLGCI